MRVIAGTAKGKRLVGPAGTATRPASDRIRETLFAILEPDLEGAVILDLFAGAGSLGIEALSRGAARVTFVERSSAALIAIRKNVAATGSGEHATVVPANVLAYLESGPTGGPYDIVFTDPPFADVAILEATLAHDGLHESLAPAALVVARVMRKHRPALPETAAIVREKEIGEETLLFLRYASRG